MLFVIQFGIKNVSICNQKKKK